jgi:integral membrane protein (TIGR01906 family)
MLDVKVLIQQVTWVWYLLLLALLGLGIWARVGRWWTSYRQGLARGGWITVGLVVVLVVVTVLSFGPLFVFFHRVFFEGDTWLFDYSTTLIRLFPMRFWQDAFIAVGVLTLAGGLALALGARPRAGSANSD